MSGACKGVCSLVVAVHIHGELRPEFARSSSALTFSLGVDVLSLVSSLTRALKIRRKNDNRNAVYSELGRQAGVS